MDERNNHIHDAAALTIRRCEEQNATVARSIHNDLAQHLTAAALEIALWQHDLQQPHTNATEAALDRLTVLAQLLQQASASARSVSSVLWPRTLECFGLVAAIESLFSRLQGRTGRECHLTCNLETVAMADGRAIQFYRVVEAWLAAAESRPIGTITAELFQAGNALHLRLVGEGAPPLPADAAARLQLFGGSWRSDVEGLTISLPL